MFKIRRRDLVRGFGLLSILTLINPFAFAKNHGSAAPQAPSRPPVVPRNLQPPPPPTEMPVAAADGFLVKGELGEYYFLNGDQLNSIAHKGNCTITECVAVSPARVVVKKKALAKFRIQGSQGLWKSLRDKELIRSLDNSIKNRQALGANVSAALAKQGFAFGIANPTKVG